MSIEGQGHFFTIYFPGVVCFVLYKATIYQVSVYRTIGPLVLIFIRNFVVCFLGALKQTHMSRSDQPTRLQNHSHDPR